MHPEAVLLPGAWRDIPGRSPGWSPQGPQHGPVSWSGGSHSPALSQTNSHTHSPAAACSCPKPTARLTAQLLPVPSSPPQTPWGSHWSWCLWRDSPTWSYPTNTPKALNRAGSPAMGSTAVRWHGRIQARHGSHPKPQDPCLSDHFTAWLSTSEAQGKEGGPPGPSSPSNR